MRKYLGIFTVAGAALLFMSGCTVHPPGEQAERNAAIAAGRPFATPASQRNTPPLPDHPSADDLVRYALLTNAELEQRYWEWRAAIEQIPQDGTQPTNFALSAGTTISKGDISREGTTLTALNDPMADIVWPEKLSVAARRALQNAHAAGLRFQKAKFDLRSNVLDACYDYALADELIQLEQANSQLLETTVTVADARNRAGAAGQQDLLKAQNELDLSRNVAAKLQSQLPALRAALNALLNRDVRAPLPLPDPLPPLKPIRYSDDRLLALAADNNPELSALASELRGRADGIQLARLQYLPDFSLTGGTDLAGLAQTLTGMVTVPVFRYEAINAAIAQAEANLRSTEAMRRQTQNDLSAQIVLDLSTFRDADRQLVLFEQSILPRARQAVGLTRSSYEAGRSTLLDLLDSQRSLIALQRLIVNLRIMRAKRVADLEAIIGRSITG
ncbi:MAG TPA: TolC family protein [Tepidisphaeraceae bacterium]|jgi:outer membrane protein TolC|nr:TolC family protein [Tepidisphaeraceae bacterium]